MFNKLSFAATQFLTTISQSVAIFQMNLNVLTNVVVAEFPKILLGSGHRRCWGAGGVDHVTVITQIIHISLEIQSHKKLSSNIISNNPWILGGSVAMLVFLFNHWSDQCCDFDQFLSGRLFSSPRYFCWDPRSQFSGGGIIRAQASDLEPVAARNDAARVTRNK